LIFNIFYLIFHKKLTLLSIVKFLDHNFPMHPIYASNWNWTLYLTKKIGIGRNKLTC